MSANRPALGRAVAAGFLLGALCAGAIASPDTTPIGAPAAAASAPAVMVTTPEAPKATPAFVEQVRDKASDMVITALNFLGVPYRRGGASETGFDCSGFTRQVFETSLGFALPRRADEQAKAPGLVAVKRAELQPGDLVFFNTLKRTFSHVGIYIGEGKFIHAPKPGGEVRVESMSFAYWAKRFTGARRAGAAAESPATR
jgi:cell wall-associated NlpC family hydrolase